MDVIGRISKDLNFPDAPITDPESPWQDAPRTEGWVRISHTTDLH